MWHPLSIFALDEKENCEKEVDIIYFPNEKWDAKTSRAALSVDLKDMNNLTVCFAFMVDGLIDAAISPDSNIFLYKLASIFQLTLH